MRLGRCVAALLLAWCGSADDACALSGPWGLRSPQQLEPHPLRSCLSAHGLGRSASLVVGRWVREIFPDLDSSGLLPDGAEAKREAEAKLYTGMAHALSLDCRSKPGSGWDACSSSVDYAQYEQLRERVVLAGLAAMGTLSSEDETSTAVADTGKLAAMMRYMRKHEMQMELGGRTDKKTVGGRCVFVSRKDGAEEETEYSCANFAYGSTFFPSWLKVVSIPEVMEAVHDARRAGRLFVTLGSTLGWQTFWAALVFGVRASGYELLAKRAVAASAIAERFHIAESKAHLVHGDALQSDLSEARIIYLTDLAWDLQLLANVSLHIAEHAPEDVTVVSNKGARCWVYAGFTSVTDLSVEVSWSSKTRFHVYKRVPISEEFIHRASRSGCEPAMRELLRRDPLALEKRDAQGRTALHLAADETMVQSLAALGADLNALESSGKTPLSYAIRVSRKIKAIWALLKVNATLEPRGEAPLEDHLALVKPNFCVCLLTLVDVDDGSPMMLDAIRMLLAAYAPLGADGCVDTYNSSALHKAERPHVVELLLQHRAEVEATDYLARTPLMMAAAHPPEINGAGAGSAPIQVVKKLLAHRADVQAKDQTGQLPLHNAAQNPIVDELLKARADIDAEDSEGQTVFSVNAGEILRLIEARADLDSLTDSRSIELSSRLELVDHLQSLNATVDEGAFALWVSRLQNAMPG